MPNRYSLLWLLLFALLVSCSQEARQVPLAEEDFHYVQMEALADAQIREVDVKNLYGGLDKLEGRVDRDARVVFQGDMIVGAAGLDEQAAFGNTETWPGNKIPYILRSMPGTTMPFSLENQIREAVTTYNRETNLSWVAWTNEPYYVVFLYDAYENEEDNLIKCSSYVGMVKGNIVKRDKDDLAELNLPEGAQPIRLTENCGGLWGALHEMGHAVGLHHEHVRPDRDDYVELNCDLIKRHFDMDCNGVGWAVIPEAEPYEDYDYYSIMHYKACKRYFSRNGKESCVELGDNGEVIENYQVMTPLKDGVDMLRIGRGFNLTRADIDGINFFYREPPKEEGFSSTIKAHHSLKCVDVPRLTRSDIQLIQWDCHGRENQVFDFEEVENKPDTYTIRSRASNKCIHIANNHDNGVAVMQKTCTGAKNQQFELRVKASGGYQIVAQHTKKCLDIVDSSMSRRAKVQQNYCYARPSEIVNQVFYLDEKP